MMIRSRSHKQGNAYRYAFLFCIFQVVFGWQTVCGQVRLPRLISDGMVLQREQPVKVWGWAGPGEKVRVRFKDQVWTLVPGAGGIWSLDLPPMHAGGPYTMEIDGSNHIVLHDILIGDVWVCSGQSNMELPMERVKEKYAKEISQSANPAIRQFNVATRYDFIEPQKDLSSGGWQPATPEAVLNFSATAYFFGKDLYQRYHVPIGLIKASVGGAPAEAWLSAAALREFPPYQELADRFANPVYTDSIRSHEEAVSKDWYLRLWARDSGLQGSARWYDPAYDDSGWPEMDLPGYWADGTSGKVNGVVWFRKEVDIPPAMVGQPIKLLLGRIVDRDSVFVNGSFVGTTGYQYPPRRYTIGPGILHAGKNWIVVRVINSSGRGGFVTDKPYLLAGGGQTISLEGKWKYRLGASMEPLAETTFFQYKPRGLYNGIVAAISSYAVKGVIWYQGEANTARAPEYARLFPTLIRDWRRSWGQDTLPFLFVQLANFMEKKDLPSESNWAVLREAQLQTLSLPRTGMAVAIDIGEWNDIHPLDKEDVGRRLALAARRIAYGEKDLVYSGPLYRSMERQGGKIRIHFSDTGGGLVARGDGLLHAFSIAGADKKFVWARAVIEGKDVIVWEPGLKDPVAVRYAWADNPADANLYNKEGLPASPFRTDEDNRPAMTAEQDHRRMMDLLHIDSLRPGPSGNPKAADAANTDENRASPYTHLPDPLVLSSGRRVVSPKIWWQRRRPEIMEDFDREVYGRVPARVPAVRWELVDSIREMDEGTAVITKKLLGHVDNSGYPSISVDIQVTLRTPAGAKGPVPVIMEFGWQWPPGMRRPPVDTTVIPWQRQVLKKGWGYAILYPTSVQEDNGAGLNSGIIGLCNKGRPRKPDDWGALRAWAWGASRALDYFEKDPAVDARQVGIEGLSRYGKAAIVAMAYEPRLAIAFVGSSGEGGVKIHRRHFGEQVENVASSYEYHWMAGNFIKYAGPLTANDLPVDAHELVALCAPRPVFISSGSPMVEGNWVDAKGMFLGGVWAGPVYKLLGKRGLPTTEFPPIGTTLAQGEVAWRQHSGGHTTGPNWPAFLEFADRYIKGPGPVRAAR